VLTPCTPGYTVSCAGSAGSWRMMLGSRSLGCVRTRAAPVCLMRVHIPPTAQAASPAAGTKPSGRATASRGHTVAPVITEHTAPIDRTGNPEQSDLGAGRLWRLGRGVKTYVSLARARRPHAGMRVCRVTCGAKNAHDAARGV